MQNLTGCQANALTANDDGSAGPVDLTSSFPNGINFYGVNWTSLYVNNNGNVSFGSAQGQYTPDNLTTAGHFPTLAPFFADVDTRGTGSGVVTYGFTSYQGHPAFCVDWPAVGYYSQGTDKLNTFQLLIVDRPDLGTSAAGDDFDFYFNYDQILWDTGSASGGVDGVCPADPSGCYPAHVGYTNGSGSTGTFFEQAGSGVPNAFLDSNTTTGLVNGPTHGVLHFTVHLGTVASVLTLSPQDLPTGSPFTSLSVSNVVPATFTSTGSAAASAYAATIDWGDGTGSDSATSITESNGVFSVSGSHNYLSDGTYTITTTVTPPGSAPTQSVHSQLVLQPPLATAGKTVVSGPSLTAQTLATFSDPDSSTRPSDYTVTVDWGDGTTSSTCTPAVVSEIPQAPGPCTVARQICECNGYVVTGTHTYSLATGSAQTFNTLTTIHENDEPSTTTAATVPGEVTITNPACTSTWITSASTTLSWLDASNWSPAVPGSADDTCVGSAAQTLLSLPATSPTMLGSLNIFSISPAPVTGPTLEIQQCSPVLGAALSVAHAITVNPGASLQIDNGCTVSAGNVDNHGTLILQPGATLQTSVLNESDGAVITAAPLPPIIGGARALHAAHIRDTSTQLGTIITGDLTNHGQLTVPAGQFIDVNGAFAQTAGATLRVTTGSPSALNVLGNAALGGNLVAGAPSNTVGSRAVATPSTTVSPVLTYGSHMGTFTLPNGANGEAAYGAHTVSYVMGQLGTVLSLMGPGATIPYGSLTTLTAFVALDLNSVASGSATSDLPAPDGVVTFTDNGAHVTRALQNGVATYQTSLTPGTHHVQVSYVGTSLWRPSTFSTDLNQAGPPTSLGGHVPNTSPPPPTPPTVILGSSPGNPSTGPTLTSTTPQGPASNGGTSNNPSSGVSGATSGGGNTNQGGSHTGTPSQVSPPFLLPSIVSVLSPLQISTNLKLIAINLLIALLLILLLALPAELLNSAVKENYNDISRWLRLSGGTARRHRLHQVASELPTHFALIFFMVVAAVLYTLLDPNFGFNLATLAELVGLLGAFLVITMAHDIARARYFKRRLRQRSRLTTFPAGIVFAVVLVLLSRVFHFQPGFIFGLMTGLAFSSKIDDRDEGRGLALASVVVLMVAVAAWILWIPVKQTVDASSDPGFGYVVLDTLLATVWVAGIQSIIFALIPLKFMDGEKVIAWNKVGWLAIYVFSMFVFVHTVLHPTSTRFGNSDQTAISSLLIMLIAFTAVAVTVWTFFFIRRRRYHEGAEERVPAD